MTAAPPPRAEEQTREESTPGLLGRILRGSSWQTFGQVAPLVINIVLTPIIIAGFGIDRYGLFLLINVIAAVLSDADGGIGGAALRYYAIYAGERDSVRTTRLLVTTSLMVTGIATLVCGALFAVAPFLLGLLQVPEALEAEGVFFLRIVIVLTALAQLRFLFSSILNAHGRFALTSVTVNIGHAIYVAGVLLTLHEDWGLYGLGWTMAVQQAVGTLLIVPGCFRHLERRWVGLMPRAELGEFGRYALHMQWADLMLLFTTQTNALVVGAFSTVRQVAYYGAGANFAMQMYNLPLNALVPMQSALGHAMGAGGVERARADFERLQRLWVIGTTGWGVVAASAAWFGVTAWLGAEFGLSGTVAVVMLVAYQLNLWARVLVLWGQILGRPEINSRSAAVGGVLNLALSLSLIVPFGVIGAVAASAVSQLAVAVLLLRLSRRRLPGETRPFWREIPVLPALATAALVVALELLARPVVPEGALGLVVTGLVAAPGLALFACMTFGPRFLWRLVRERTGR